MTFQHLRYHRPREEASRYDGIVVIPSCDCCKELVDRECLSFSVVGTGLPSSREVDAEVVQSKIRPRMGFVRLQLGLGESGTPLWQLLKRFEPEQLEVDEIADAYLQDLRQQATRTPQDGMMYEQ